jgi:DNA-binding NarL/FixJ family response regulator
MICQQGCKLKITVCCAHPVTALGLQTLFARHEEIEGRVTGDLDGWLEESKGEEAGIILVDVGSGSDLGFLARINRKSNLKVALWVDSLSAGVGFQALDLGVRGILRKTLGLEDLIHHLWDIQDGNLWIDKELLSEIDATRAVRLTTRESQLVELLAQGLKNKEIAWSLKLTENTIKAYMSRLFQKLGVKDRLDLALYGMKNRNAGGSSHLRCGRELSGTTRQRAWVAPWQENKGETLIV